MDTGPYLSDWDERLLQLGKPYLMDTLTFIEWLQQQMETDQETIIRHNLMAFKHEDWHWAHPGEQLCCRKTYGTRIHDLMAVRQGMMTPNEARTIRQTFEDLKGSMDQYQISYLSDGVEIRRYGDGKVVRRYYD